MWGCQPPGYPHPNLYPLWLRFAGLNCAEPTDFEAKHATLAAVNRRVPNIELLLPPD